MKKTQKSLNSAIEEPSASRCETLKLAIKKISRNEGTQARLALDAKTVEDYQLLMTDGQKFPPVVVFYDGENYVLADGFHRVEAAEKADWREIEAVVREGGKRDAVLFAVGANSHHGLRRTNADKRKAVAILLKDEEWRTWSDRTIADTCGVHHDLVGKVREELTGVDRQVETERTYTRNGKTQVMKTAKIGKTKAQNSPEPVAQEEQSVDSAAAGSKMENVGLVDAVGSRPQADSDKVLRAMREKLSSALDQEEAAELKETIREALMLLEPLLSPIDES